MSSVWGEQLTISIFGESHGGGIGVVLDGIEPGIPVDPEAIKNQMKRRAPGGDTVSTPRREADEPEILSGVYEGKTTGTPLAAVIRNGNTRSGDYAGFTAFPRPGHADYTGEMRYHGFSDPRGGGHFSGRLTAPLVFAGTICRAALEQRGVFIGSHAAEIAGVADEPFDPVKIDEKTLRRLSGEYFPLVNRAVEPEMREKIEMARAEQDSVGGIVECAAVGLPAGIGDPMFGGVENRLASILFGIPAVRGVEFGAGFAAARMRGSEHNDPFARENGRVVTTKNAHGGVLGGITTGMPLIFRAAFKPTPSIARAQRTVDLSAPEKEGSVERTIGGRHDPCVVVRALPVVEAAAAVALLELVYRSEAYR